VAYAVDFASGAARQFRNLSEDIQNRLEPRINALADNPRPAGAKKLKGTEGYRLRVGDYRILYEIQDDTARVLIVTIGHRREVYRGR